MPATADHLVSPAEGWLAAASAWYAEHGHLRVPKVHVTSSGVHLGLWLMRCRAKYRTETLDADIARALTLLDSAWTARPTYSVPRPDAAQAWWRRNQQHVAKVVDLLSGYAAVHGDLRIPRRYVTPDGFSLGAVMANYRLRARQNILPADALARLAGLDPHWLDDQPLTAAQQRGVAAARRWHAQHGHLRVPIRQIAEDGLALGTWLGGLRCDYARAAVPTALAAALHDIDPDWMVLLRLPRLVAAAAWERWLDDARQFRHLHGHLDVPHSYRTADGRQLWQWLHQQRGLRRRGDIDPHVEAELSRLEMVWDRRGPRAYLRACRQWCHHSPLSQLPSQHVTSDGLWLGSWLGRRRAERRDGTLDPAVGAALDTMDPRWAVTPSSSAGRHRQVLAAAKTYAAQHGSLDLPQGYVTDDGLQLGQFLFRCRRRAYDGTLPPHLSDALTEIDPQWTVSLSAHHRALERRLEAARAFHSEHGHLRIPLKYRTSDEIRLGMWLGVRRRLQRAATLDPLTAAALQAIDPSWATPPPADPAKPQRSAPIITMAEKRQRMLAAAAVYATEHGNLQVPRSFIADNGCPLGESLIHYRQQAVIGRIIPDIACELSTLDPDWAVRIDQRKRSRPPHDTKLAHSQAMLRKARSFHADYGHLHIPTSYHTSDGVRLGQWLQKRRAQHRTGTLAHATADGLNAIDPHWAALTRRPPTRQPRPKRRTAALIQADRHGRLLGAAAVYAADNGNLQVPRNHVAADGLRLGESLRRQRRLAAVGTIHPNLAQQLSELDPSWQKRPSRRVGARQPGHTELARLEWMLQAAQQFHHQHGHLRIPVRHRTPAGLGLGPWLTRRRSQHRHGTLRPSIGDRLDDIDPTWTQAEKRRLRHR